MVTIKPVGFFKVIGAAAAPLPEGVIPDAGEFGTVWIEGVQSATNTDGVTMDNYDGGGAPRLGLNLDDDGDFGYLVFMWAHGIVFADNTAVGTVQLREDTGAFTGTTPSVVGAATGLDVRVQDAGGSDASHHWMQTLMKIRPGTGRESEFGVWFVELGNVSTYTVNSVALIVLPVEIPATTVDHSGSNLIPTKTRQAAPGTLDPVGITAADTDNTSTDGDVDIVESGEYLIFCPVRVEGVNNADNSGISSIRWTMTDDDVDIFGVKTNTTTSGAVRTGRGFQHNTHQLAGSNKQRTSFCPFVVRNMGVSTHTFNLVGNKWDNGNDGTERIIAEGNMLVKTDQFDPFVCREDTTATVVDFDTFTDWNEGVTVTGDGVKEFFIGISTTLHTETAGTGLDMQITRNGSRLDTVLIARHNPYGTGDGADGAADSDNCLLPVTIFISDIPDAGSATYKLQIKRSGGANSSIINGNDNGASGFKGTMFAAGISFRFSS